VNIFSVLLFYGFHGGSGPERPCMVGLALASLSTLRHKHALPLGLPMGHTSERRPVNFSIERLLGECWTISEDLY
jgi:hypothetical protein